MEPKHFSIVTMLLILVSSCSAPRYVPKLEEVPFSAYGSHIEVQQIKGSQIEGELIAVEDSALVLLTGAESAKQLQELPFNNISKFKLTYAQPQSYAWTIPVYTLSTASHGLFAIFTAPINIAVTSVVTSRGVNAFTYNEKVMEYKELRQFARFPQGIPPNVDRASIR